MVCRLIKNMADPPFFYKEKMDIRLENEAREFAIKLRDAIRKGLNKRNEGYNIEKNRRLNRWPHKEKSINEQARLLSDQFKSHLLESLEDGCVAFRFVYLPGMSINVIRLSRRFSWPVIHGLDYLNGSSDLVRAYQDTDLMFELMLFT